jgi:hypothetical protein
MIVLAGLQLSAVITTNFSTSKAEMTVVNSGGGKKRDSEVWITSLNLHFAEI